jgi:hypothetical protein
MHMDRFPVIAVREEFAAVLFENDRNKYLCPCVILGPIN